MGQTQATLLIRTVANLVPLAGVLWSGWSLPTLLFWYWLENVVVGFSTVAKMSIAKGGRLRMLEWPLVIRVGIKLFLIPFFLVHYGAFTFGHGLFLYVFFGRPDLSPVVLLSGLIPMLLTYIVQFQREYIASGRYLAASPIELMFAAYPRVIIFHLTVSLGGFAVLALGTPVVGLIVLVALKIVAESIVTFLSKHRMPSTTILQA